MPNNESEESRPKRFRIAFSFAGEKRDFVEETARILANRFSEEVILYDKFHEAAFAEADLAFDLPALYKDESDLIVAVFSPDYDKKEWCGLEWRAIFSIIKEGGSRQILLSRFDHIDGKGLFGLGGFIELDKKTPEKFANLILERLALNEGKPKGHYTKRKRKSASESARGSSARTDATPRLTIPNNLPRLSVFFGREKELKTIADALSPKTRTWGVLIDGPGGMGKTAVAIRAAESVPEGQFDRILFISSKQRALSADGERKLTGFVVPGYLEMLNEVARLLDKPDLAKRPEDERARVVIDALVPARALLIFDNLESLPKEQQDQLFEFLSQLPLGCKAIVTSRRRRDVDARGIRLAKLGQEAALALLEELSTDRPLLRRASEAERLHLYEETGGNPLLLRWIAGQLGRGSCRSLAKALDLCRNAANENDPLEFIFGDLLETFTEAETKALAALSYFTQMVEVKHIAEIADLSKVAAETALNDLANRALVVPDEEERNFALVPMVADFLRRKRSEVVTEAGDRLEGRAYALVVESGHKNHDRFPVLDAAWPTIVAALPRFLAGENRRLQKVCDALADFLEFTGRWDEWSSLSRDAEGRAVAAGDSKRAGWRAFHVGWLSYLREQSSETLACADRAEAHWKKAQAGSRERGSAVRLRGLGYKVLKDYASAIGAFRKAVEHWRTLSRENRDVAVGLNDLASVEWLSGDPSSAERDYREAVRISRAIDDDDGIAAGISSLAFLALDRSDWIGAEALAREAVTLAEAIGRLGTIAASSFNLAKALAQQGRQEEALPYARRAVEVYQKLGYPKIRQARQVLAECESRPEKTG